MFDVRLGAALGVVVVAATFVAPASADRQGATVVTGVINNCQGAPDNPACEIEVRAVSTPHGAAGFFRRSDTTWRVDSVKYLEQYNAWCVAGTNDDGATNIPQAAILIRDVGDGVATLDEIGIIGRRPPVDVDWCDYIAQHVEPSFFEVPAGDFRILPPE